MNMEVECLKYVGKILPIDGYEVQLQRSLSTDYTHSLVHLYQPLIGIDAISLYFTLLHDIHLQPEGQLQTHHTLMNQLNMSLDKIYEARLTLEGIGLMKTFQHEMDDNVYYIYQLNAPFRPVEFFQDVMLSELLYRHIGTSRFKLLHKYYTKQQVEQISGKNVTASFKEVFQTFHPSEERVINFQDRHKNTPQSPADPVNFQVIEQGLERQKIPPRSILTK